MVKYKASILLLILLIGSIGMCEATAKESFIVKGNSGKFAYDKKENAVYLSDCIVNDFTILGDIVHRKCPEAYQNADTLQTLFDEILRGEVISPSSIEGNYSSNNWRGVQIDFTATTNDANHGFLEIKRMDSSHQPSNTLSISMGTRTRNGSRSHSFVVKSMQLWSMIDAISAPIYVLETLGDSISMELTDAERTIICDDIEAIHHMLDVIGNGTRLEAWVQMNIHRHIVFTLQTGRHEDLYISMIEPGDEHVILKTRDSFYRVTREALNEAYVLAGFG